MPIPKVQAIGMKLVLKKIYAEVVDRKPSPV
jgi:hypothetical protein